MINEVQSTLFLEIKSKKMASQKFKSSPGWALFNLIIAALSWTGFYYFETALPESTFGQKAPILFFSIINSLLSIYWAIPRPIEEEE